MVLHPVPICGFLQCGAHCQFHCSSFWSKGDLDPSKLATVRNAVSCSPKGL